MKYILYLLSFLTLHLSTNAQQQFISGGEKDLQGMLDAQGTVLFSSKHTAAPPAKDLHINHVLTLEINPALTPDLAKNFSVSIHIIASFVNTSGSPEQEEKDLQVTYTAKGQYRAKDAFEKEGADIVDYKLTAVSVKDGNGAPIGITPANKNMVLLKQHLQFDRYPEPNPLGAIGSQDITVSNDKGYARLSWAQVPWALAYDVEYSYTDNYTLQTGNFNTPANTGYNFRFNSTRVQVKNAAYEIPLVYENGYLVFRVRPVGLWGSRFDKVVTGRWSISADEGNSLTGEQVGAEGHFFCTIEKKAVHEDDSKNWQYMALFAEEGKRKDNVTYLDGTLRNRQSIINLNTQQNLLVNETIYDNLGRPAISVLPTPLIPAGFPNTHTPRIEYQVALNQNMAGKPYSWKDFDIDRNCTLFPDKFNPSSSGAARYYSPNNPFIDASGSGVKRQMAFVADAAGYPFIQKEYTPDNSGRIKRLSAPGTTFSFGPDPSTTHEQRYFYGTPSQEELDRVFGNDIGFASHYSKEIKIDENYQASVTYKNLKGNIVATALAGLPPKSLTPLSEPVNRKKIRVNIIDERNYTENNSIIATFPLVMTETDSLDLAYGVTQKGLPFSICKQPTKLCYDCVYDLGLKITDACGKELYDIKETIGTLDRLRECESDPIKFTRNKTIKLSPGSYFISKTLTVNENAIAAYIDNYLNDPCWTNQIQLPPPVDCTPVKCNIITIEKGDDCDTNSLTGITRPKIRHLPQPQPVDADCTPSIGKDIGSISIQKMLADLSPGGQYAQYPTAGDPLSSVYNYPLSVLNTNNQLPSRGNWKNPVYAYRNKNGMEIFIEKVVNGVVKRLAPQDLTLDEFLQNWDPGMAYSLLPYHPEYCYYEWGAEHKNYFDYEDKMKATEKFPSNPAEFGPLLKAPYLLPDTLKDPLFIENKTLIPQMIKYMTDMAALQPGLGTVKMVDLASISAAGFSGDVTPVQAMSYIANHNPLLFNDPDLKDEEWTKFKFYYLMARTKIIEELRAKKIINNQRPSCCMQNEYIGNITCQGLPNNGFCALFAAKTPVYPTQGRIQTIINTGTSLPVPSSGTDINCLNCAQPQSYVLFLNTLQAKNQLFANRRITGSQLGMIANTGSDAIIAKGDHIKWVSVRTVNRLDAKLIHEEDASVLCTITLSSADSLFDWDKMVNFSCLKSAGAAGDFRLTAWDAQTAPFILNGNSSCFFTKECAPPTEFTTSCVNREYTPLFVEMLEKALISVSAGNIPSEIITGRRPASNAYPAGKDPVNLWHITGNTPIGNNFDIPLNFSTSSNIPASKISIRSTNNLFASFADWRITGYELVPQPRQTEHCDEINTIKIKVQKRLQPQVSDFFLVSFDLPLGTCCEFDKANALCCMPGTSGLPTVTQPTCIEIQNLQAYNNRQILTDQLKQHWADSLRAKYILHCLHPVETFTLDYEEQLYHYTLYYYDQADLLTKIIPPAGVHLLSDPAVKQAALFRNTGTGDPVQPQHSMATTNKYNSLNTIIANSSPDGGSTLYCYDELGRLIYKQDANQSANPAVRRASFTSYDNIGRVIQTGEIPVKYFQLPSHLTYLEFNDQLQASDKYKTDVVTTFYDRPATPINGGFDFNLSTLHQRNLRNRVSANIYHRSFMDNTPYTHAFFYNYDIDGNIDTLVQDNRFLENYAVRLNLCSGLGFHRFKTMAYNYDLISKKVNSNWYQPNQIDQLLHLYEYDADNRLVKVRTTTRPWEHPSDIDIDAAYQFYLHGPIARLELGQEKIQGLDYTYTLQGWMKGVNSSLPGAGADPGKDDGTAFLKDAFAYGLNYYPKDYTPIGTSSPMPETENTALGQGFSKPVFNGNIRNMLTMLDAFSNDKVQATAYNYDVLGRMMSMQAYQPKNSQLAVWQDGNFTEAYHTQYGYDPNGNILTLSRKDGAGTIMDNLSYTYKPNTNQVSMILDAAGNPTGKDILNNNQYAYDAGGRLIKRSEGPSPSNNFDISWSGFDRLRNIKKNENNIEFVYNAAINRALTFDEASRNATYYVRDLVGNALAIYSLTPTDVLLDEQLLYGQERIGTLNAHTKLTAAETTDKLTFFRGSKEYELTNHLGNVLATVSDRRIPSGTGWTSDNLTAQDYYPFGTIMSKRSLNKPGTYRYGFNGKEMDTLIDDRNINLDFGARAYLSGTGQWLTMDPLADKYPGLSPYHFAFDNPVKFIDPDGRKVYASKNANNTYTVTGGTLDDDRGIYVKDKKGREKQIGESLTANSFFSDEGKVVVGAIIDPSTKEGTQFLLDVVNDKKTGLVEYALNARNGYKYDYKSRNTPAVLSGKGRDVYHYRAEALFTKNGVKVFATARDIGNIGAGYKTGSSGISWGFSRLVFDGFDSYKRKKIGTESPTTQDAERIGWQLGESLRNQANKPAPSPSPSPISAPPVIAPPPTNPVPPASLYNGVPPPLL